MRDFAKPLATAAPSGHSRVSWQSPSGALGPGMAVPVEDDQKKYCFSLKNFFL